MIQRLHENNEQLIDSTFKPLTKHSFPRNRGVSCAKLDRMDTKWNISSETYELLFNKNIYNAVVINNSI